MLKIFSLSFWGTWNWINKLILRIGLTQSLCPDKPGRSFAFAGI
jgi:hypothetical protein